MTKSKMKKLALAVGVALGGMSQISTTQAMNLATDGLGQVLIFPYYTVQGGWTTAFNVTNTSSFYVAAKVRFHESYNSRDVFDFNVILSPHDVWNGYVAKKGEGPAFYSLDKSCTTFSALEKDVPLNLASDGVPFYSPELGIDGTVAYTGNADDSGPQDVARMNEGYLEVIMMGSATGNTGNAAVDSLVRGAKHDHNNQDTPPGCYNLAIAFQTFPGTPPGIDFPTLQFAFNNPGMGGLNPLKGSYNIVKADEGWTASGSPTTIANFSNGGNLMTTALPPGGAVPFSLSYLEPTLNSGITPAVGTNQNDGALPSTGLIGIAAVSDLLARAQVINQWSRITQNTNGWVTATDWVLTFPTKAFYADNYPDTVYSARAAERDVVAAPSIPAPLPANFPAPFAEVFDDAESCVSIAGFKIYNREEYDQPGSGVSPGGASQALCYETNVLTFGTPGLVATNILDSAHAQGITLLPGDNGFMNVPFTPTAVNGVTNVLQGLPVIGFMITTRDTQSGTSAGGLNEAFLVDHAYSRNPLPLNP